MSHGQSLRETHRLRVASGLHASSLPVGYLPCRLITEPDPRLEPLIRDAIQAAASGSTLAQVRDLLVERGFRTRRGKVPSPDTVSNMVTNPFYAGYVVLEGRVYPGLHRPIVPLETVIAAARRLEGRRLGTSSRNADPSKRYRLLTDGFDWPAEANI